MKDFVEWLVVVSLLAGFLTAGGFAARQGYLYGRDVGYRQCLGEQD